MNEIVISSDKWRGKKLYSNRQTSMQAAQLDPHLDMVSFSFLTGLIVALGQASKTNFMPLLHIFRESIETRNPKIKNVCSG